MTCRPPQRTGELPRLRELPWLNELPCLHCCTALHALPAGGGYLANLAPSQFMSHFEQRLPAEMKGADFLRQARALRCAACSSGAELSGPSAALAAGCACASPANTQGLGCSFPLLLAPGRPCCCAGCAAAGRCALPRASCGLCQAMLLLRRCPHCTPPMSVRRFPCRSFRAARAAVWHPLGWRHIH